MNFWLWVAKKEAIIGQEGCWGDCGPDVQVGDICFIYHKNPKSYIEEMALVKSESVQDCHIETQKGVIINGHCCKYEIIHEFVYPLQYRDMKVNPLLDDWISTNKNLQGMFFEVDDVICNLIDGKLKEINENYCGYNSLI
ncbi:EVE domain-containing protein [Methanobacterium spitsbergense]|uniref:EVE domain-containing protein n=1 Tax=Methanobacterium spitsbergense TaxID=2874285 RepID=A0A8T5UR99_9EURY|nr:EVE domain-containing protein [Methanobacterium spitsbergense]MBZ2164496.1 EVE domain-containing protein [Methanobacterium spitsbergense]